jgi:peptide/nickel transport system permease protein
MKLRVTQLMHRRVVVVTIIAALAVIYLLFGGVVMKSDPNAVDIAHWQGVPLPPCFLDIKECGGHALGTDQIGRDVLVRLVFGGRVSLGIGLLTVVLELIFGIALGTLARFGTVLRFIVLQIGEAVSCFPAFPFIVFVVVADTPERTLTLSVGVLAAVTALLFSPPIIRLTADVGKECSLSRALADQAARDLTKIIVLLATVDFIGRGVQPPTASWGNMLSGSGTSLFNAWWIFVFPAICITFALLTIEIGRRVIAARYPRSDVGHELAPSP